MSESDLEFVERFRAQWKDQGKLVGADRHRLLSLARRGAETQWRPIEEAPRDSELKHIGRHPDGHIELVEYFKGSRKWLGHSLQSHQYVTHFIPLSALGEPE